MFYTANPLNLLTNLDIPFITVAKGVLVIFLAAYVLSAIVLHRQAKVLTNILGTPLSSAIIGVSWFHLGFSLMMLVLSFLVL